MTKQFTKDYTPAEVLAMVAGAEFRDFTRTDWYAWAGCETENPRIGEYQHRDDSGRVSTLVIDGRTINVVDHAGDRYDEYGGRMYQMANLD